MHFSPLLKKSLGQVPRAMLTFSASESVAIIYKLDVFGII